MYEAFGYNRAENQEADFMNDIRNFYQRTLIRVPQRLYPFYREQPDRNQVPTPEFSIITNPIISDDLSKFEIERLVNIQFSPKFSIVIDPSKTFSLRKPEEGEGYVIRNIFIKGDDGSVLDLMSTCNTRIKTLLTFAHIDDLYYPPYKSKGMLHDAFVQLGVQITEGKTWDIDKFIVTFLYEHGHAEDLRFYRGNPYMQTPEETLKQERNAWSIALAKIRNIQSRFPQSNFIKFDKDVMKYALGTYKPLPEEL